MNDDWLYCHVMDKWNFSPNCFFHWEEPIFIGILGLKDKLCKSIIVPIKCKSFKKVVHKLNKL